MKIIRFAQMAMLFAFCLIMSSLSSYSQELKVLLDEQLKAAPKFDRAGAEKKALAELGLNKMPSEVADGKELADLVGMEAEKLAVLKFTAEMKAKVQQEAKAKFKAVQQGDEITVQVRQGAGFVDYKGKYKGTAGEKLLVGERQILKSDLQPDMLERLDAGKVAMAQGAYLSTNFTEPRKRYIAEQAEKLNKGFVEKRKAYNNFISVVDTEEKDYKSGLKEKTIESVIGKYLERKQADIEKLPNDKDKLKAYDNLVAEIKTFLNTEGVTKTLESYVSMKSVISETIPALEKTEGERLAAEKREADEKRIAGEKVTAKMVQSETRSQSKNNLGSNIDIAARIKDAGLETDAKRQHDAGQTLAKKYINEWSTYTGEQQWAISMAVKEFKSHCFSSPDGLIKDMQYYDLDTLWGEVDLALKTAIAYRTENNILEYALNQSESLYWAADPKRLKKLSPEHMTLMAQAFCLGLEDVGGTGVTELKCKLSPAELKKLMALPKTVKLPDGVVKRQQAAGKAIIEKYISGWDSMSYAQQCAALEAVNGFVNTVQCVYLDMESEDSTYKIDDFLDLYCADYVIKLRQRQVESSDFKYDVDLLVASDCQMADPRFNGKSSYSVVERVQLLKEFCAGMADALKNKKEGLWLKDKTATPKLQEQEKVAHKERIVDEKVGVDRKALEKNEVVQRKTAWEEDEVKGKVKECVSISYDVKKKFGEDTKEITGKIIYRYDEKGDKLEEMEYDANDAFTCKSIYKNYANKTEGFVYNKDGSLISKFICKYNDGGNKSQNSIYKADGTLSRKHIYKYDAKGNQIEWAAYKADGALEYRYIFKYNDNGNLEEGLRYDLEGCLQFKTIYKYDSKGNRTEWTNYNADGTLSSKLIPKYDLKWNKIEEARYNEKGILIGIDMSSFTYY